MARRVLVVAFLLGSAAGWSPLPARRLWHPAPRERWPSFAQRLELTDWLAEATAEPEPTVPPPSRRAAAYAAELWAGLEREGRLSYLTGAARRRMEAALVALTLHALAQEAGADLERLAAADADDDGRISLAEFDAWVTGEDWTEAPSLQSIDWASYEGAGAGSRSDGRSGMRALNEEETRRGNDSQEPRGFLWRALELVGILLDLKCDADTVVAALARETLAVATGRHHAAALDAADDAFLLDNFGPVAAQIVRDSLAVPALYAPAYAPEEDVAWLTRRASDAAGPVPDWSDENAQVLRSVILQRSSDARGILLHTGYLLYLLRRAPASEAVVHAAAAAARFKPRSASPAQWRSGRGPVDSREEAPPPYEPPAEMVEAAEAQLLGLETLQLMLPLTQALLASGRRSPTRPRGAERVLRELECRSYAAVTPRAFVEVSRWHKEHFGAGSHGAAVAVLARAALAHALRKSTLLQERISRVEVQSRTKDLPAVFRKVFRQGKRHEDIHDGVGLRVIVDPLSERQRQRRRARVALKLSPDAVGPGPRQAASGAVAAAAAFRGFRRVPVPAVQRLAPSMIESNLPPDQETQLLYDVYHEVTTLWAEVPGRFKNYVAEPKANGYRSLHTTVWYDHEAQEPLPPGPGGLALSRGSFRQAMEVQIRTRQMHVHAEGGDAAHGLYKGGLEAAPKDVLIDVQALRDTLASPLADLEIEVEMEASLETPEQALR